MFLSSSNWNSPGRARAYAAVAATSDVARRRAAALLSERNGAGTTSDLMMEEWSTGPLCVLPGTRVRISQR